MTVDGLYKEDAEKLARQMEDDNPMIDILDIKMDPGISGYVIVAYDNETDEEFTVDRPETWVERAATTGPRPLSQLVIRVKEKHDRKVAVLGGKWTEVTPENWPGHIREAVERRELPGENLVDIEPGASDADIVEPGHGAPAEYGFDGSYLVHLGEQDTRVWRQILKVANFTLEDQSHLSSEWRALGFEIAPEPLAPMVEPGSEEWSEAYILEEVIDRLLDISEKGYGAILVDGQTSVMAYAWVLACRMGLKVISSWSRAGMTSRSGFSGLGYSELIHYHDVEESL